MAIDLKTDENLFGDAIAAAPEIDRGTLARALYAQLKDVTLDEFVAMFTNSFEAVVDYANLAIGERTGQRISLLFNPHRLDTGTKRFPISLYQALKDDKFISGLARVVLLNKKKGATKDLLYASVGMGVQGTSYVQEFPPHVARDLALEYGLSKFCKVLDPCAGWGGRMLGFSTVVDYYTCCEPSTRTAAGLRHIYRFIKDFRSDFQADIHESPFEDVELPAASFDFAMTSPPYYDTERYAPGEAANSFNRYATFDAWCIGFYAPLIHRTMRALKPGACFIINIGSRLYPLNDRLMEIARDRYVVQKQDGKLSASNGLGKSGEGETFYEVKNPGVYVSPDGPSALPVVISMPPAAVLIAETVTAAAHNKLINDMHARVSAPLSASDVFDAFSSDVLGDLTTRKAALDAPFVAIAHELSRAMTAAEIDALIETAAPAAQAATPEPFNPLDAFLSVSVAEPPSVTPAVAVALPEVYQNDTPHAADAHDAERDDERMTVTVDALSFALDVLSAPQEVKDSAPRVVQTAAALVQESSPHEIAAMMAERGHALFARQGKLVITNASTLTDEERDVLRENKAALLVVVPTFPEAENAKSHSLIQFLGEVPAAAGAPTDWKLEAPPSLEGIPEIRFDWETNGLKWNEGDRPIGFSLKRPGMPSKYYPFAHVGAENLDEETMKRWAREQLKGKRIVNAYTGFEVHMSRAWGVDLVEQGNTFSDVMHYAALLDDNRKQFNLNILAKDFLKREKVGLDLDPTRMAHYEPWLVAARAEGDTDTVDELVAVMYPLMEAEGLHTVRALEDAIIPVVCEMEWNGAPVDMELLTQWGVESEQHYHRLIKEVSAEAGFNFDDSDASWMRLFEKYNIPIVTVKKFDQENNRIIDTGKPTFKDTVIEHIDHPGIKLARFASQLSSLRSKIYTAYPPNIDSNGILRFSLNQLRIDDENGKRGTVSGRFSADYIQQVPNHDNHFATFGELYYPRMLYRAGNGMLFFAGDASQIEYRILAHLAKNTRVLQAYRDDPLTSFHKLMYARMSHFKSDFSYTNQKSLNFMKIYGGSQIKTAQMMKFITEEQGWQIKIAKSQSTTPLLAQAREIEAIYDRELPEVKPLTKKAMHLAMPKCDKFCKPNDTLHQQFKHRGYVRTTLGRRARFPNGYKIHKALNSIIQGSAADIMKTKLVELFAQRKDLGFTMRMTIHDEVCGDVPDVESAEKIKTLMNVQSIPMDVPILWTGGTGKNWAEAK